MSLRSFTVRFCAATLLAGAAAFTSASAYPWRGSYQDRLYDLQQNSLARFHMPRYAPPPYYHYSGPSLSPINDVGNYIFPRRSRH
jgi:hypothetical protein